jgi:hypothetical protein
MSVSISPVLPLAVFSSARSPTGSAGASRCCVASSSPVRAIWLVWLSGAALPLAFELPALFALMGV